MLLVRILAFTDAMGKNEPRIAEFFVVSKTDNGIGRRALGERVIVINTMVRRGAARPEDSSTVIGLDR